MYNFRSKMTDYDNEKWQELYRVALLELKRAAMTGRISDARVEIEKRLEVLEQLSGLHDEEKSAIQDALNALRGLEREEEHLAAEDKKRILQQAVQTLEKITPK